MPKKRVPSPEEQWKHLTHRTDMWPVEQGENEYTDAGIQLSSYPRQASVRRASVLVLFFVKPQPSPQTGD